MTSTPLFSLGRVVATRNALSTLTPEEIAAAIARHASGDWGLVGPEDWAENELSLKEGFRLFSVYRDRLKRMIELRLSRRLSGRVDDSDVLQEAYLEIARKLGDYARDPKLPPFLWMRHLTALKLVEVHRRHLGSQIRDADREVTLHRGCLPMADSASLAAPGTRTTA